MTTETIAREEQRTYVFCPDEPFLIVWVNGRGLQFNNGRLVSTHYQNVPGGNGRRELSAADIEYFRLEEARAMARGEEPQFIVFDGEIDDPVTKQVLSNYLRERVMRTCSRKAWASDPQKVMDDANLTLAAMMATDDGLPDVRNMPQDMPSIVRSLERTMPSAGKMLKDMIEMSRGFSLNPSQDYADMTDARRRDEEAIRIAASGNPDDLSALAGAQNTDPGAAPAAPAAPAASSPFAGI